MPDDLPRIPKKRRPRNKPRSDAWLQQSLKAYRPSFTFRCALPVIAATSIVCIGMGITLIYNNTKATEHVIDYTDCEKAESEESWRHTQDERGRHICEYEFRLPEDFTGDITFYYGLGGFYQNIRKYQQSRNDNQLRGDLHNVDECFPYERNKETKEPFVPCGAVANSMFNDSFQLFTIDSDTGEKSIVEMSALEIIPKRFRERKYKNPKPCRGNVTVCPGFEGTSKPEHWQVHIAEIGDAETGRGLENADFIIWMETSALPNFRKVYRKLKVLPANDFNGGLPMGRYMLRIHNNYPTENWDGRKTFVIESRGPLGPTALFQTIAYMTIGIMLFFLALFMFVVEFGGSTFVKGREFFSSVQRRMAVQTIDGM